MKTPKHDSDFSETQLSSKTVYRGGFLELKEDRVKLPDGNSAVREYLIHPGAVVMIPVLDDGMLVLGILPHPLMALCVNSIARSL